jgi:hypothetical protein
MQRPFGDKKTHNRQESMIRSTLASFMQNFGQICEVIAHQFMQNRDDFSNSAGSSPSGSHTSYSITHFISNQLVSA